MKGRKVIRFNQEVKLHFICIAMVRDTTSGVKQMAQR